MTLYRTRAEAGEDNPLGPPGVDRRSHAAIRERRQVTLEAGVNRIRLDRLPASIAPSTVQVRAGTSGVRVVSTRLAGAHPVERRDLFGRVALELDSGQAISGVVAGAGGGRVAIRDGGVVRLLWAASIDSVRAEGSGPVIEAVVEAPRAGRYPIELRYQAGAIRWDIAYTAIRAGDTVELSASLELENRSGAAFPGADMTLVDRVIASVPIGLANGETSIAAIDERRAVAAGVGLVAGESERGLGPTENLRASHVLVVEIEQPRQTGRFPTSSCTAFAQLSGGHRATDMIELRPGAGRRASLLPGSVRLLDRTPSGRLSPAAEGELEIDRGAGVVRLAVGRQSGISARRHQLGCDTDDERSQLRETLELEISNATGKDAVVLARVPMNRWHNWRVVSESIPGRSWAQGREYRIEIASGASQTIRYTAVYDW